MEKEPQEILGDPFTDYHQEMNFSVMKNEIQDNSIYAFCDDGNIFMKVETYGLV